MLKVTRQNTIGTLKQSDQTLIFESFLSFMMVFDESIFDKVINPRLNVCC